MTNKNEETTNNNETDVDEYYDGLVDFIVDKWKEKGHVTDEESTRECIGAMLFLMTSYNFKCLVSTFFDMYELCDEYDELMEDEV